MENNLNIGDYVKIDNISSDLIIHYGIVEEIIYNVSPRYSTKAKVRVFIFKADNILSLKPICKPFYGVYYSDINFTKKIKNKNLIEDLKLEHKLYLLKES